MSNLVWPEWMPPPQVSSYGIKPIETRIVSETEAGTIIRNQFNTDECEASCTLVLNTLQANFFEAFELHILEHGSKWFDMPLLSGGTVKKHRCQFKERPAITSVSALHTTYSLTLRVEKRQIMSRASALFLYTFGVGDDVDWSFSSKLHTILHENAVNSTNVHSELL